MRVSSRAKTSGPTETLRCYQGSKSTHHAMPDVSGLPCPGPRGRGSWIQWHIADNVMSHGLHSEGRRWGLAECCGPGTSLRTCFVSEEARELLGARVACCTAASRPMSLDLEGTEPRRTSEKAAQLCGRNMRDQWVGLYFSPHDAAYSLRRDLIGVRARR